MLTAPLLPELAIPELKKAALQRYWRDVSFN